MTTSLGDRMKRYEKAVDHHLIRRSPVVVRVDGRAFHTFTKNMDRPFDRHFMASMLTAAQNTCKEMQCFRVGYVQSDEASFALLDTDTLTTEPWFGNDHSKIVSVAAATMTAEFNQAYFAARPRTARPPVFDARAFNIPMEEVSNYFLWRAKDWQRNSLQMAARANFSHKALHRKSTADLHELLHEAGINWARDVDPRCRNGTFFFGNRFVSHPRAQFDAVDKIIRNALFGESLCVHPENMTRCNWCDIEEGDEEEAPDTDAEGISLSPESLNRQQWETEDEPE